MKQKLLEEYFNKLRGKSIDLNNVEPDIASLGEDIHTSLIDVIKSSNYASMGGNKTFNVITDKNGTNNFAILKSKKKYAKCEQQFKLLEIDDNIKINSILRSMGAKVPKLYTMFYADSNFIEIQELALGDPIAYSNVIFLKQKVLGGSSSPSQLTTEEKEKVGKELYNYNVGQQQKILSLPDSAFDDLLQTYLLFGKMNFLMEDSHAGNVLVSDKGFTVIDVDYSSILHKLKFNDKPTSLASCESFIAPFATSTLLTFKGLLTPNQFEQIRFNNIEIFKKLFDAISRKNIIINFDTVRNSFSYNSLISQLKNSLGSERFFMKYDYILDSQIKLYESKGLPKGDYFKELKDNKQKIVESIKVNDYKKFS